MNKLRCSHIKGKILEILALCQHLSTFMHFTAKVTNPNLPVVRKIVPAVLVSWRRRARLS